jgi:D-alanyl-D-alanine carboxypeptidase
MPAPIAKPEATHATAFAAPTPDEALAETLAAAAPIETTAPSASPPPSARSAVVGKLAAVAVAAKEAAVPAAKAEPAPAAKVVASTKVEEHYASAPRHTRGGWAIQVGAYEDEGEAKQKISLAKSTITSVVQKAEAYIERTVKGAKTYYRARFAGFDRDQAEAACKRLKREDLACMALKI